MKYLGWALFAGALFLLSKKNREIEKLIDLSIEYWCGIDQRNDAIIHDERVRSSE